MVLLHDAGGVREATITALPEMIDTLRAEGYRFVAIHELLELPRDEIMPSVAIDGALVAQVDSVGFSAISGFNWFAFLHLLSEPRPGRDPAGLGIVNGPCP